MSEVALTDARNRLSTIVDDAHREPVYLLKHHRPVAAIVDVDLLAHLMEDAEELADIRAVDAAWAEAERLSELPVPWDEVKHDLGLS
ncbi:type II toxin-antitoxin system Phd/YefM family antitoxin [Curtobacterium ammoniigenes]|uniref:type II toxin-antitoxin system Phd/YefM family antitoxin n=1 Tax=Curtobacterium ammoniigenes TaxID=395387 RepID=UPI00082A387D|nr:type II toxin-antitoxin system Phd/YefM family antitoxin [Curtobacterium ammoniigenes]